MLLALEIEVWRKMPFTNVMPHTTYGYLNHKVQGLYPLSGL